MSEAIEQANAILRERGYKEAQLGVFATPMPTKALIKGSRIVSPFADSPEIVLRAVLEGVPPADSLGTRQITPHELRACLELADG